MDSEKDVGVGAGAAGEFLEIAIHVVAASSDGGTDGVTRGSGREFHVANGEELWARDEEEEEEKVEGLKTSREPRESRGRGGISEVGFWVRSSIYINLEQACDLH